MAMRHACLINIITALSLLALRLASCLANSVENHSKQILKKLKPPDPYLQHLFKSTFVYNCHCGAPKLSSKYFTKEMK